MKRLLLVVSLLVPPALLAAQGQVPGLNPADLYKPLKDEWLSYSGDFTGRRYSALNLVNKTNVKNLSLNWVSRMNGQGPPMAGGLGGFGGFGRGGGAGAYTTPIVGGFGSGELGVGTPTIKGFVLVHDGRMYTCAPDHVWAIDARDGHELWHYFWKARGSTHIGCRGVGIWKEKLFFETPDDYLVALDTKTGKELWKTEFVSFNQQYFSTFPPIIIDDHVIVGTGNDLDMPGIFQSFNADTYKLEWKLYTVPMDENDPALKTWPSLDAARHGGGQIWVPGAFDPETRLYIVGTGNPTPGYTGAGRKGDNLYTCSLIAVNVDTGKMAWYFQTSPHDTHDWDSTQTPILIDAPINGRMRKLVLQATRNGYYFTLDRVTGENIVTTKYGSRTNWAKGIRPNGSPDPDPEKEATIPGALVSPVEGGVTNWPPPAFSPDTGLFYINEHNSYNILYLTDADPRGGMGLSGKQPAAVGDSENFLTAIDPKTGKVVWRHKYTGSGGGGLLTTAGGLLFTGDGSGNFVAFDAATGKPLWHTRIGNITNAPETYMLDGKQHVLVAVGDALYDFVLN